jgi:CRP-like cAMP-binding protein
MFRQEYANLAIFHGMDQTQIAALSPYLDEVHFQRGTVIFSQGQAAECLYILLWGEVQVQYKPYDGPVLTVARIMPGDVFGWSAALGRDVYTSSAEASEDGAAYRIRAENLQRLHDRDPKAGGLLLERLASVIAERLRNTHSSILALLNMGLERKGNTRKRSVDHDRR